KKEIWLKGLLTKSRYELRLVAGIATCALVKGGSGSEVPAQVEVLVLKPNNFHGSIQPSFAVKSPFPCLQVLDLSRNSIEIESLDLSWNQLKGNIPQSLVGIKGNLGLCGFPLPKKCSHKPQPEEHENREDKSGFTWEVVTLGYGCGTLLGLVMGYLMLSTRKVKWFNLTADAGEHMILERNKRRYVFIGK
ncbi:leucine-rich repeat-containing protein, partial [Tanacetum coccineum]